MTPSQPLSPGGSTLAVLDANVLLPPRLSDFLFDLFLCGLYHPRWTSDIEAEYLRNFAAVVRTTNRAKNKLHKAAQPHPIAQAEARLRCFRAAVGPEYEVLLYQSTRYTNMVPKRVHPNDQHVASAALVLYTLGQRETAANRVFIVTNNVRHLAATEMRQCGVEVLTPGRFIDALNAVAPAKVEHALNKTIHDLIAPRYSSSEAVNLLLTHGARKTAHHLARLWHIALPA